ncbi:MAG: hypothetical protein ACJA0P_001730 [Planctomycetota bacterium]|jgi:hypothetical protein
MATALSNTELARAHAPVARDDIAAGRSCCSYLDQRAFDQRTNIVRVYGFGGSARRATSTARIGPVSGTMHARGEREAHDVCDLVTERGHSLARLLLRTLNARAQAAAVERRSTTGSGSYERQLCRTWTRHLIGALEFVRRLLKLTEEISAHGRDQSFR